MVSSNIWIKFYLPYKFRCKTILSRATRIIKINSMSFSYQIDIRIVSGWIKDSQRTVRFGFLYNIFKNNAENVNTKILYVFFYNYFSLLFSGLLFISLFLVIYILICSSNAETTSVRINSYKKNQQHRQTKIPLQIYVHETRFAGTMLASVIPEMRRVH